MLVGAYAVGAAGAGGLVLAGALGNVVGNYATPFHGELLPTGFWRAVAAHLDQVVVGSGVLPFALAASWAATSLIRPQGRSGHAFAALFAVLVPLLTFEVTSFDLRFTPNRFIQDRYLIYLVPLFAVGAAAWLAQRTDWKLRVASLAVVGAGLVALLGWIELDDPIIFWAAPGAAVQPALAAAADLVGLSTELFLRLVTVAALLAVVAAAWRLPRAALAGTAAALAALGIFQAWYVLDRYADPVMTREPASGARDWIDAAVPTDRSVALVPSPLDAPTYWWEAELWNKRVDRVLRVGRGRPYTPFPADRVRIDYADGRLRGAEPSSYLVLSRRETRFRLAGATPLGRAAPLRLVHVRRAYRLAWATRGVTADGWTRPGQTARLRLYGHGGAARRRIVLTLAASRFAAKPIEFELRGRQDVVRGGVDPGGARPPVRLSVCVPADGHADAALTTAGSSRLPDGRVVALHLDGLEVEDAGACG